MKFYINGKKITKAEALTLITERQLAEAKQAHIEDPYEEQSYMTSRGILVIEF